MSVDTPKATRIVRESEVKARASGCASDAKYKADETLSPCLPYPPHPILARDVLTLCNSARGFTSPLSDCVGCRVRKEKKKKRNLKMKGPRGKEDDADRKRANEIEIYSQPETRAEGFVALAIRFLTLIIIHS